MYSNSKRGISETLLPNLSERDRELSPFNFPRTLVSVLLYKIVLLSADLTISFLMSTVSLPVFVIVNLRVVVTDEPAVVREIDSPMQVIYMLYAPCVYPTFSSNSTSTVVED